MASTTHRRRPIMVANWKMYKTPADTTAFFVQLNQQLAGVSPRCFMVVAPSFTCIPAAVSAARGLNGGVEVAIAGQNLHWEPEGAYTGEVSASMLVAGGCRYVIVGHSERRQYFAETDETVHRKVKAALAAGLTPIVCIGETAEQRAVGETEIVLKYQFQRAFWGCEAGELNACVLAYEPIWAIGTGNAATPEIAQATQRYIRHCVQETYGAEVAAAFSILYGGSIKTENVAALMAQEDVDGGLVGGASLDPATFVELARVGAQ